MKFLDYEMHTWVDGETGDYPIRTWLLHRSPWLEIRITGHELRPDNWSGSGVLFGQHLKPVRLKPITHSIGVIVAAYEDEVIRVRDEFLSIGKGG